MNLIIPSVISLGRILLFKCKHILFSKYDVDFLETEKITLEEIIKWFKSSEVVDLLKGDSNRKAVFIRNIKSLTDFEINGIDKLSNNNIYFQAVINTKKNEVVKVRIINYKTEEEYLELLFKNKDIIIFE